MQEQKENSPPHPQLAQRLFCDRGRLDIHSLSLEPRMTDTPPDHLSINPRSPHFDGDALQRGVGIRFKDRVRTDVEEYSLSEGWIRVAAGKSKDRFGQSMTIKLSGPVSAWFEDVGEQGGGAAPAADADADAGTEE
jgi:hypothetical protein